MSMDDQSRPLANAPVPPAGAHREAIDAGDLPRLQEDPSCGESQTEVALDETFPASDPVSPAKPGANEPMPSSGFPE